MSTENPPSLDRRSRQPSDASRANDSNAPPGAKESSTASSRLGPGYGIVGLLLLLYVAAFVAFAVVFQPNLQFFAYYVVNYDQGFIRRGLAGEILDLSPRTTTLPDC